MQIITLISFGLLMIQQVAKKHYGIYCIKATVFEQINFTQHFLSWKILSGSYTHVS